MPISASNGRNWIVPAEAQVEASLAESTNLAATYAQ